jgi:hypothetical protein
VNPIRRYFADWISRFVRCARRSEPGGGETCRSVRPGEKPGRRVAPSDRHSIPGNGNEGTERVGSRLNPRARWLLPIAGSLTGMRPAPPGVGQWFVFGKPCVIDPLGAREVMPKGVTGMEEIFSSGKVSEVPPFRPLTGKEDCLRAREAPSGVSRVQGQYHHPVTSVPGG